MKRILNRWFVALFAAVAMLAGGCTDPDGVIDELNLDRVLSPLDFTVRVENNVNANFSWTAADGVQNYQLDLQYEDGTSYQMLTIPATGESSMEYYMSELPGQRLYTAFLYALSEDPNTANSKASIVSFETGIEQLFLQDGVVADADIQPTQITLRWVAGSNVTHLELSDGANTQRIELDDAAKAAGVYTLTGLTTDKAYTAKIFRDVAERGVCSFVPTTIYTLDIVEKGAETMTIGWASTAQVDEVRVSGGELTEKSFAVAAGATSCSITGLTPLVEYHFMAYYQGIYHGRIVVATLGKSTKWDFTTWEAQTFAENTTIDGLTILATSAKPVTIEADPDGIHRLNLGGKSTVKSGVPTERALQFEVACDGVVALDCHRDTNCERGFAVYVEALGKSTEFVISPTKDNSATIYIPVTGITEKTNVMIWSDNTMRHTYSLEWTEGAEAPGQMATALATPEVTVTPTMVNVGEAAGLEIAWKAIENASSYTWALKGATDAEGNPIGGTTSELKVSVPAEVVAALAPATYTASVVAVPSSTYLYKNSAAGTADFTVSDMVLATPKVTFTPAKVVAGDETEVVASWEAVMNAASYQVSFNGGAATTQTETSYTLSAADVKALAAGEYKISVVALPDPNDAGREQSAAGEATLTVDTPPVTPPSGDVSLIWDFADASFDAVAATIGTDNSFTSSVEWNGLTIDGGGKTMKMNGSGSSRGVQPGGAGSETQRYFAFTAPAGGTLTVTSSNTGSSEDMTRMVTVSLDGTVVASQPGGSPTSAPTVTTFDISAAGQVKIYPTGNGLRFYKIEFTSVAAAEPVVYSWGHDYYADLITTYGTGDQKADLDMGNGLKYYVGASGKWKVGADDTSLTDGTKINRIQFGGSGKPGNTPMQNVMELVVEGPGTLEMTIRSASKTDIRT
ncbi:MAG: hypothetical protein IJ028_03015, partial [Alistipes sp.]|nr:hypothetical protein [Alistipes sp.]